MSTLYILASSGGLDSTTLAYKILSEDASNKLYLVNIDYGQRNIIEMNVQEKLYKRLVKQYGDRIIGKMTLNLTSVFTEVNGVDKNHEFYTPSRNLVFMSALSSIGEAVAINGKFDSLKIGLGVHKHSEEAYGEFSQYWDITPTFVKKLNDVLALNNVIPTEIYAPYKDKYKGDIIKDSVKFNIKPKHTWTCYSPERVLVKKNGVSIYTPCKLCEACKERELQATAVGITGINDYTIKVK